MKCTEFRKQHERVMPGVPVFFDVALWVALKKPKIDIVKLDEWARKSDGYVEDGKTSLEDHIRAKYGEEAVAFIKRHL